MIIRLPSDKFSSLLTSIERWYKRRKCTKRELLSLIGSLSFACKVIKPGRIFLRRLFFLSTKVTKLNHHLDISSSVRSDLLMWFDLLKSWNGVSVFQSSPVSASDLRLFTDASFLGMGGYFNGSWFSSPWIFDISNLHISILELFSVYSAVLTWGESLRNQQVIIFTDNEAIVKVWESGSSKDENIMVLVRSLFFACVHLNLSVFLKHLPGHRNVFADLLSRLQVRKFLTLCPTALDLPSRIPQEVWKVFTKD